MRIHVAATLILSILMAFPGAQEDGPFGLSFGASREALVKLVGPIKQTDAASGGMVVSSVPKPHPDFESYLVMASATHGLCKVTAVGETIQINSFGNQIKEKFTELASTIQAKYGPGQRQDFLQAGSIWNEPEDWAMALAKEERVLAMIWETPKVPAGSALSAIMLRAHALNTSAAYVILTYEARTFAACASELQAPTRSVL